MEKGFNTLEKVLMVLSIVGFLLVDILFFHDIFKVGEVITFPQILTGILSIFIFVEFIKILIKK